MVKKGMDWGVLRLTRKWVVCLERVIRVEVVDLIWN